MHQDQEKREINAFNLITLEPGCRAAINEHVFSSGIELEEEMTLKQNDLHLQLTDLIEIETHEEKYFLELLKQEQAISKNPIDIIDVKKKYHLKLIQKKNNLVGKIFGSTSLVMIIFIIIISFVMMRKCFQKKENNQ